MTTGNRLLRDLDKSSSEIEISVRGLASQIDALERDKGKLATQEAHLWSRFAAIQIAGAAGLPSQIEAILKKRETRVAEARKTVSELDVVIAELEKTRIAKAVLASNDSKLLKEKVSAAEQSFSSDEKATALRVSLTNLNDRLSAIQDKHQRAVDEFETKKIAYDADELFSYLRRRNFDTVEYNGWGLLSRLDRWLANAIDYRKSFGNYTLLENIPAWIKQREMILAAERVTAAEKVDEIRKLHFTDVESFVSTAKASSDDLAKIDAEISQNGQERQTESQYIASSALATDDDMNRAIKSFADMLSIKGINSLQEAAARTASQEDDEIVLQLSRIGKQKSQITGQIDALRPGLNEFQRRLTALEEVKRNLRSRGWTGSDDEFSGRHSVSDLAVGVITASDFWSRVQRSYEEPRVRYGDCTDPDSSSRSSSSSSWSSGSSSGGFGGDTSWSTGGGFGGGDSNSGGGF